MERQPQRLLYANCHSFFAVYLKCDILAMLNLRLLDSFLQDGIQHKSVSSPISVAHCILLLIIQTRHALFLAASERLTGDMQATQTQSV